MATLDQSSQRDRRAAQRGDVPDDPLSKLRHTASHVMAAAVTQLFPETKVTIGPAIENGFFYDFDRQTPFTEADLEKIEAKMKEIVAANHPMVRQAIARDSALDRFQKLGEKYKVELIQGFPADEEVSLYSCGDFVDLCRGPHVESTGKVKAFKLLSVAGAYWRGDEKNAQLQRIYGTAFESQKELDEYLHRLEEAKKRDHRRLGKDLDLFTIDETIGGGLVLWHPKGARVRVAIEDFWRKAHLEGGYDVVFSPHVAREALWDKSGHTSFYKENMYSGMDVDGQQYLVKPMNCPFHATIFKSRLRSYRELPQRWAELGTVYRYERSGVLHGLLRVRGFTQDDAHLFIRKDQVDAEVDRVLGFVLDILKAFGFHEYEIYLATRPAKSVGSDENWVLATDALKKAIETRGLPYQVDEGGGAFYGSKIDIKIKDSLGRAWQCSTIQVDFNIPERLDLEYVGEDGQRHRPIMIHRALLGSIERFFAVLVEHHAGAFPLWLAPVQARILPITERVTDFVLEVEETFKKAGLRVEVDWKNDKLGAKVRDAQLAKVPVMLVVGDKEAAARSVAPRYRDGKTEAPVELESFVRRLAAEAAPPVLGAAPSKEPSN
jgi:threonyl-tRNA synthetase